MERCLCSLPVIFSWLCRMPARWNSTLPLSGDPEALGGGPSGLHLGHAGFLGSVGPADRLDDSHHRREQEGRARALGGGLGLGGRSTAAGASRGSRRRESRPLRAPGSRRRGPRLCGRRGLGLRLGGGGSLRVGRGVGARGRGALGDRILEGRDHHHHVAAVEVRPALDDGEVLQSSASRSRICSTALRVQQLTAAEHDRDLDLVAVAQEPLDVTLLGRVVVRVDLGPELDLLDGDRALVAPGLLGLLLLLVRATCRSP